AALLLLAVPAAAHASGREGTTFQDDDLLVFGSAETQARTLDTVRSLGADRVRVSVFWNAIAPDAKSKTRPGFDATDPAAYPPGNWARYDRLVRLAAARGLGLNFDLTGPAPLWATGKPERADIEATYAPSAAEFGAFVTAVARRDSGDYPPPAPPAPAPAPDARRGIDPLRFIRALYCVDRALRPLRGAAATALGCPADAAGQASFAADHPVLFDSTGWAHHPYELTFSPHRAPPHRDWVTIANLPQLTATLSGALRRYGRPRPGGLPLYLTEFGYQTNPPDRFGVSWAQQAAYLDESEFLTYVNPVVRTLGQFLLRDDGGDLGLTFQSGLMTQGGERKPSYDAFELPVYLPRTTFARGRSLRVWGMARCAPNNSAQDVAVEFRSPRSARWRALATLHADGAYGYVDGHVRFPG